MVAKRAGAGAKFNLIILAGLLGTLCISSAYGRCRMLDFFGAVIVHPSKSPRLSRAAQFLQHEIQLRTGIKLPTSTSMPAGTLPAIVIGTVKVFPISYALPLGLSVPRKAEGFAIWIDMQSRSAPVVYLLGRDERGALFAAGRLVQLLYLSRNHIHVPADIRIATAPADAIRAHQIISSTQCKDGFIDWNDTAQKQQYIRDLVLFGTNGFEMRPPNDVDEFLEELGIDLFIKVTCSDIVEYSKLTDEQISKLFTDLVGVDHFTTYGGDASGSLPAPQVFPKMERVIPLILQSHPGAKWWYSNQCLKNHAEDYDDYIFNYIKTKKPTWLYGMVYGPWTKRSIPEIRADLPKQYKIRHYPEICHVRWCQYPIPKWDRVWAQVWPRNQSIYAMPRMMAQIYRATRRGTVGFLPYNHTGCYNDLNKFVWSALGWDPNAKVEDILYDYAKVFFAYDFKKYPGIDDNGPDSKDAIIEAAARDVARGLLLLEENWTGALADNKSTEVALELWKKIAANMGGVGKNWRLELFLYRAFLDAHIKRKYDLESRCERQAYDALRQAEKIGLSAAIRKARAALARADTQFQSKASFKQRLKAWGLSGKFGDLDKVLDNMYSPLNDRRWLETKLDAATCIADIKKILNWEDPGPGGFYDNLGCVGQQPHLIRQKSWQEDPGFIYSPIEWVDHKPGSKRRHSQMTHATCRYDTPLLMRWEGLDPKATYHINVVYRGPFSPIFTCKTDDGFLIHGPRGNTDEEPVSCKIPPASTADGVLQLQWNLINQVRGVSVTEIWLIKEPACTQ